MKIHILGICGSFMGGIAMLAKQLGQEVAGCDANVYPPMSTQLAEQGIALTSGFDPEQLAYRPDLVIIGNALMRGNPAVEYVLNENLAYMSGPAWLSEFVLKERHVLAVAGTHGKTTTASMLAWVLESAGLAPGFMIGGVPENFGVSARAGNAPYFVIEADEYDSAFFDKRSKFVHYRPRTLVLNNLEFDHADIFPDLAAIQTQFHHLVRIVPEQGLIISPAEDENIQQVLQQGCWSEQDVIGKKGWHAKLLSPDGAEFEVYYQQNRQTKVMWNLLGEHNVHNALAVFAAAAHIGVKPEAVAEGLANFKNVKRRMQVRGVVNGITVYDDFAHHPTAIQLTLEGLRNKVGSARIIAIVECGSYTMRAGVHSQRLLPAVQAADEVIFYKECDAWEIEGDSDVAWQSFAKVPDVLAASLALAQAGDHILVMSNRGFDGVHEKLLAALE
jgi:UDP-N-acetylmuramate: L-alanyl-gamma-D-glutamyl-meso-diaminopimelate ligase